VPKGVRQTYRNLRFDVDACIEKAQLKSHHRFLGVLPLFHSFGLTAMLFVPVALGASIHYVPRFQPAGLFEIIRQQESSVTMMIASMYAAMLRAKQATASDVASIEFAISGGEALSPAVFASFKERLGVEILQGYGMTEAAPVVSLNVPWAHKIGSVGQAIPGVEAKSFDDNGNPAAADQPGELWIRGPIIMKGYYHKDSETRAVLTPDGWYKSGDMATVDAEGYITITGRKKEMIIVGGENVYPREIECVLDEHPAVAESAVIGQKDSSRGEVVVAFVVLRDGAAATDIALRDFCRERIAGYKVPRRVVIAHDLPRGPTGKILKRRLPELL
jgi:long-chain acyl-CoA synthetase